jgi:HlyD family secretion protein
MFHVPKRRNVKAMAKRGLKLVLMLSGALALVVLILYMGGFMASGLIAPRLETAQAAEAPAGMTQALVKRVTWPDFYEAVGTVRPRTETRVEAQVSARVQKVLVRAGDRVQAGQLLAQLDVSQLMTKQGQADQGLKSARAALDLAQAEYGRISRLYQKKAAPKRDMDRASEALKQAQATMKRSEEQVAEARIASSYTRITAPEAGQVIQRLTEPGDLALPGRPLLILQTGGALRLEANVREGFISRVRQGQKLEVLVPALGGKLRGQVEEIIPSADPLTRTFLVKVVIKNAPGIYSGMFGRLLIPVGQSQVVLAPSSAITRVGQLELVTVLEKTGARRIYVTTGRKRGDDIEILSGLMGGETLLIKAQ